MAYLIKHIYEPAMQKGGLVFKCTGTQPSAGVEVTSLTNKKYVVGERGNLIKINPHKGSSFDSFLEEVGDSDVVNKEA
jgi:hypothetical protein